MSANGATRGHRRLRARERLEAEVTGTLAPEAPAEPRGVTWQKLLLGDWSRIVRDPLDVYRILFVGGALVWGLSGRPVAVLVAASAILLLARLIDLPRFYDFSLIVVMVLVAWGEVLGLYDSWKGYDNVVHFTVPFLLTGMVYVLLVRLGVLPELSDLKQVHQKFGFFLTAVMLGMAIGAGWEIVEWSMDEWAGSNLVGSATDTATDLIWDTMGATLSAIVLTLWSLGGHSLRRRPGAALADKRFGSFLTLHSDRCLAESTAKETRWLTRGARHEINTDAPVVGSSEIEIAAAPASPGMSSPRSVGGRAGIPRSSPWLSREGSTKDRLSAGSQGRARSGPPSRTWRGPPGSPGPARRSASRRPTSTPSSRATETRWSGPRSRTKEWSPASSSDASRRCSTARSRRASAPEGRSRAARPQA